MRFSNGFGVLAVGLAAIATAAHADPQTEHGQGAERKAAAHSNGHGNDDVIHAPPPPVYPTFEELTGVQTLATAGVAYGFVPSPGTLTIPFSKGAQAFGSGVTAIYDPATGNVTYTAPDGKTASFTSADIVGTPTANSRQYQKAIPGGVTGGVFSAPSVAGVPLTYTRVGTFYMSTAAGTDGHTFVMGVPTLAGDMPTSGTASYTTVVGGSAYLGLPGQYQLAGNSSATFTADFATGQISTDLSLAATPTFGGAPIFLDTLVGTGAMGAVKPGFTGTFAGTGTVTGDFGGAFFGPQASEMGYNFVVGGTSAGGQTFGAIGAVFGTK